MLDTEMTKLKILLSEFPARDLLGLSPSLITQRHEILTRLKGSVIKELYNSKARSIKGRDSSAERTEAESGHSLRSQGSRRQIDRWTRLELLCARWIRGWSDRKILRTLERLRQQSEPKGEFIEDHLK